MIFCYLDTYTFYISDHKPGTCATILKDYWKGRCTIRVITWGLFCSSVVMDLVEIMYGPFFVRQCSLAFVYLMCGPRQPYFSEAQRCPKVGHPCSNATHSRRRRQERHTLRRHAKRASGLQLAGCYQVSLKIPTWFSLADDSKNAAFQDSANAFPSS